MTCHVAEDQSIYTGATQWTSCGILGSIAPGTYGLKAYACLRRRDSFLVRMSSIALRNKPNHQQRQTSSKKELDDRDSLSSAPGRCQRRSNTLRPLAMPAGGSVGEPIESHNLCSIERSQSTRITSPSDRCSVCGKLHDDGLACIALLSRASGRPTNRQLTRYIHRSLAGTLPSLPQPLMY